MKINIFKHKKLYRNTLITFILMLFMWIILFLPSNITVGIDHSEYSNLNLFSTILVIGFNGLIVIAMVFNHSNLNLENIFWSIIVILIYSLFITMLILFIIYFIWLCKILIEKDVEVKYSKLITIQVILILTILSFLIINMNIFSLIILILELIFSVYNLVYLLRYKKHLASN